MKIKRRKNIFHGTILRGPGTSAGPGGDRLNFVTAPAGSSESLNETETHELINTEVASYATIYSIVTAFFFRNSGRRFRTGRAVSSDGVECQLRMVMAVEEVIMCVTVVTHLL